MSPGLWETGKQKARSLKCFWNSWDIRRPRRFGDFSM
ncbi:unnamed protein product [Larinioides sclopetarius]|uniref:Uncharacterized protein n=1 Tax=Larinioides sclopetarius TaxID=280406 RepID=A0AAV2BPK5_9ARAC